MTRQQRRRSECLALRAAMQLARWIAEEERGKKEQEPVYGRQNFCDDHA